MDPLLLTRLVEHGLTAAGRYLMVRVVLADKPGALASLTNALGKIGLNLLTVEHRRSGAPVGVSEVEVILTLETATRTIATKSYRRYGRRVSRRNRTASETRPGDERVSPEGSALRKNSDKQATFRDVSPFAVDIVGRCADDGRARDRCRRQRALTLISTLEPTIHAWAYLDHERARREAAEAAMQGGSLLGLVAGIKDIFDTADQPSEYGSPIYAGHQPLADASAVALLRQQGAVCIGKTVTSEFAFAHPGPTANPHRTTHTPGGSSMGSAAAVAAGMVDFAIGTQTAGSIIKPASFCGVYGFKPTFGNVSIAGAKAFAPSLDTVGWFARGPVLLDQVRVELTGQPEAAALGKAHRIGLLAHRAMERMYR